MAVTTTLHETLHKEPFNEEIQAHGIDCTLRKGIRCPCASEESRQPDPTCSLCDGWGTLWDSGATIRAFGPNRRINRMFEEPGSIDLADAYFTFKADTFVSHLDRLIVPIENIVYSEFFTKGAVNALTAATKEKSRFTTIKLVERAVWSKRNPPTGTPYTYDLFELTQGVDFQINGNQINWLVGGNPPDTGARYTLRLHTNSEYFVWSPRGRAEGSVNFPYQYLCKRLDFVRAPGN